MIFGKDSLSGRCIEGKTHGLVGSSAWTISERTEAEPMMMLIQALLTAKSKSSARRTATRNMAEFFLSLR
jgi:hypothetical protein